jgi:hypothetical protein
MKRTPTDFSQGDLPADIDLPDLRSPETPNSFAMEIRFVGAIFPDINKNGNDIRKRRLITAIAFGDARRSISPFNSRGFVELVRSGHEQSESKLRSVSDHGSLSAR